MRNFLRLPIHFFIVLFPVYLQGQSLKISPAPFSVNSEISVFIEFSVEYKDFGVHYFHSLSDKYWTIDTKRYKGYAGKSVSTFGLSYTPVHILETVSVGGLYTFQKFPVGLASNYNFIIDIGRNFNRSRISVTHISNGFGFLHKVNPGYNAVSFRYFL